MITRKEYLDGLYTHEQYYGQFVNNRIKTIVLEEIGLERLKASTDPNLNDIPLLEWDDLLCIIAWIL